ILNDNFSGTVVDTDSATMFCKNSTEVDEGQSLFSKTADGSEKESNSSADIFAVPSKLVWRTNAELADEPQQDDDHLPQSKTSGLCSIRLGHYVSGRNSYSD